MIICCMNCTSAGECGGRVALVDDGNVRVGWPGAPGWTITGVVDSCALTRSDNKLARATAARNPHFIGLNSLSMEDLTRQRNIRRCLISNIEYAGCFRKVAQLIAHAFWPALCRVRHPSSSGYILPSSKRIRTIKRINPIPPLGQ